MAFSEVSIYKSGNNSPAVGQNQVWTAKKTSTTLLEGIDREFGLRNAHRDLRSGDESGNAWHHIRNSSYR